MSKYLSASEVATEAAKLATKLGIQLPDTEELAVSLMDRDDLPQIFKTETVSLWVDKLYIAYSFEDSDNVLYYYLTDSYIEEERDTYKEASEARKKDVILPRDIRMQFLLAEVTMTKNRKKYHFFETL